MHVMFWILLFLLNDVYSIRVYVDLCNSFLMVVYYTVQVYHGLFNHPIFARYLGGIQ